MPSTASIAASALSITRAVSHPHSGDASRSDVAALTQRLAAGDGDIRVQGNRIAALMGKGPDRALSLSRPHLAPEGIDALPDDLNLNLLGRRPDVIAARLHIEAASDQIKYTAADFYPNVKLSAYLGVEALSKGGFNQLFRDGSDVGSIGPAISLPLFKGGRLRAAYRYDFVDAPVKLRAAFASTGGLNTPGNAFTFVGPDPDTGNVVLGASMGAGTDTWHLGFSFDWVRGNNNSTTQMGTISLLGRI